MMRALVITIVVLVSVGLVHYSYVDFRFRARDGVLWFWLMNPAPRLVWISRGAIIGAALAALSIMAFGAILPIAIAIVLLMIVHIAALVILEIREG